MYASSKSSATLNNVMLNGFPEKPSWCLPSCSPPVSRTGYCFRSLTYSTDDSGIRFYFHYLSGEKEKLSGAKGFPCPDPDEDTICEDSQNGDRLGF